MKDQRINFYAACPIWFWPWLWLQFRRLDAWAAQRVAAGDPCGVVLQMDRRGNLTITYMSDNLRDDLTLTYATLTFEDLTAEYFPDWMHTVMCTLASPREIGDPSSTFTCGNEIADALLPIP